jgi:hypothetical protein
MYIFLCGPRNRYRDATATKNILEARPEVKFNLSVNTARNREERGDAEGWHPMVRKCSLYLRLGTAEECPGEWGATSYDRRYHDLDDFSLSIFIVAFIKTVDEDDPLPDLLPRMLQLV